MNANELEAVWQSHVESDVSVVDSLALELTRLAPKKWVALQEKAQGITPGDKAPADAVAEFAGHVASRLVLDGVIAAAFRRARAHDAAIEWGAKALACTPRWDPVGVSLVTNGIAWSLFLQGDHETAVRWAERSVAADPTYGNALGTLCEALGHVDRARALAVYRRLAQAGYPAPTWGGFNPGKDGGSERAKPLAPADFAAHTDDDAHRLRVAQQFDKNLAEVTRYHDHAVLLVGTGRLQPAYVAATMAVSLAERADDATQVRMLADAIAGSLDAGFVDEVRAGKGRFARDPETRAKAIDALVEAKDLAAIEEMVFDASYGVSMTACEGLVTLSACEPFVPYLELATSLEHKMGQGIYSGWYPKPFELTRGARRKKPETSGESLVAQVIAKVKEGDGGAISIPAPEPVPEAVLDKLVLAEGVPLSPPLRAWLAFDGGWLAQEYGWFKDPASPVIAPVYVHGVVHEHISDVFAPAFLELPGKLAGVRALPLDAGSESMRMLALVPGPDGEYPVIWIDVDDSPCLGIEAPSFDVWLAASAGLIGDLRRQYDTENKKVASYLMGGDESWQDVGYGEGTPDGFAGRVKAEKQAAIAEGKRLAAAWKRLAPKRGKAEVPPLPEDKLAEALAESIKAKRATRMKAFLEDAKARFPEGRKWKDAAVAAAVVGENLELTRDLLALGADVNAKYYLDNRLVHAGAYQESVAMLGMLLDAGADVDPRGYSKQTPLHDACDNRRVDAVRVLLEHKADANARDENERTPLMQASRVFAEKRAAEYPKTVEIATLLLDAGADVRGRNTQTTPLHYAIEQRNHELAKLLISRGADLEAKNYAGDNASMAARTSGDPKTLDLLRDHGAKSGEKNRSGVSLDDIVQADGITPAVFEVRLLCSEEPQKVTVRARWMPQKFTSIEHCHGPITALHDLAQAGMAGSDVFPPTSGRGKAEVHTTNGPHDTASGQPKWIELESVGPVAGVSPAALALVVRGLTDVSGFDAVAIEITGELPLDGSARSVDTARAKGWLSRLSDEPYRRWPTLTATVAERPAAETFGRVTATANGAAKVQAFADAFRIFAAMLVPLGVTDLRDKLSLAGRRAVRGKVSEGVTTLEPMWRALPGVRAQGVDPKTLRAAFEHGVEKLFAANAIESADWSLGVKGGQRAKK